MRALHTHARWIGRFTTPFVDHGGGLDRALERFSDEMRELETQLASTPGANGWEWEVRGYHAAMERAFALAASPSRDPGDALGRTLAAHARAVLLEEVILPYDRLFGRPKGNDSLLGLGERARAAFEFRLQSEPGLAAEGISRALTTFDALLTILEEVREESRADWGDSRLVWIPFQLALRPEDHDSQAELNALIERAVERPFTSGNRSWYIPNLQWQWEIAESVQRARQYHVLWLHDFRGEDDLRDPDELGYLHTLNYLRTLRDRVREYDETGTLPIFNIFLDQWYYEIQDGDLWLDILEDPLREEPSLKSGFEEMEQQIRALQAELREAVEGSARLQERARRYGEDWLRNRIKIHISVTNPYDPSFWSRSVLPDPFWADAAMRDHRKIAFYDISEEDPFEGRALIGGMGIGELYAGPTWEDRGLLIQGPLALEIKHAAYRLLRTQGLEEDQVPPFLRPRPLPADYDERIARASTPRPGAEFTHDVKGIQLHNDTGYAPRLITVTQAILYTLMPPGTVIVDPDSLWNSPMWAAMLLGSCSRGVQVLIIGPSKANAPNPTSLPMSRQYELFARLLLAKQILGDEIGSAGGALHTGLYDLSMHVQDVRSRLERAVEGYRAHPFLAGFGEPHPDLLAAVDRIRGELEDFDLPFGTLPGESDLVPDSLKPKLHRKTRLFLTGSMLRRILARPELARAFEAIARERARVVQAQGVYNDIRDFWRVGEEPFGDLLRAVEEEAPGEYSSAIAYMLVGSSNEDYRSMLMDGEVAVLLAERSTLQGILDFGIIVGVSDWIESIEELEALVPAYRGMSYRFARWLRKGV